MPTDIDVPTFDFIFTAVVAVAAVFVICLRWALEFTAPLASREPELTAAEYEQLRRRL